MKAYIVISILNIHNGILLIYNWYNNVDLVLQKFHQCALKYFTMTDTDKI